MASDGPDRPRVASFAIELTTHCNQRCGYCYNRWRAGGRHRHDEPSTAVVLARLTKLLDTFEAGHITLTGGEPFARSDIWELLDLLRAREVPVQIISNGGLVTPALAERLAGYQVRYVQLTLNGPTAAIHGEHSGSPEHFAQTLRGVEALGRWGVPVVGCTVLTSKNAATVGAILERWRSVGVSQAALSRFSPAGGAAAHAARLLPTRGDVMEAFEQAASYAREQGLRISSTMPIPHCMMEVERYAPIELGHCAIGTSMQELALGPDGRLRNCTLHSTPIGGADVLAEGLDLAALLADDEITGYRRRYPEFCLGCLYAESCGGGCGAASEWIFGRAKPRRKPDPFLWQHLDDDFAARLEEQKERLAAAATRDTKDEEHEGSSEAAEGAAEQR